MRSGAYPGGLILLLQVYMSIYESKENLVWRERPGGRYSSLERNAATVDDKGGDAVEQYPCVELLNCRL